MNVGTLIGKRNHTRNATKRWWGKLADGTIGEVKENVEQLATLLQMRYGYTRAKAELEARHLLNEYDRKVYDVVRRLPGDMVPKVTRYPWASLTTMLGLGLLLGFLIKPNRCP